MFISNCYQVDEDKVVIVLLVRAGSLAPGEHVMTCQISDASRDGTTVISSEGMRSVTFKRRHCIAHEIIRGGK